MKLWTSILAGLAISTAMPSFVAAEERQAIIIANRNYETLRDLPEAPRAVAFAQTLRQSGFDVAVYRDQDTNDMRRATGSILSALNRGERVLVFLSGNFVHAGPEAYLLATDARTPVRYTAGEAAMSIHALLHNLGEDAGRAVLMIGEAKAPFRRSGVPATGVGTLAVPQGVTVLAGPTDALADFARDEFLKQGVSMADALSRAPDSIRAMGYVAAHDAFIPVEAQDTTPAVDPDYEFFVFTQAERVGTEAALRGYLQRFPNGQFAAQARALIADLSRDPVEVARDAEQALRLSRNDKRDIQANLTLLGFSTNGVDGIFGNGTRNAVRRWERANNFEVTGYLSRDDIDLLAASASVERKKIEREDAAYWRETGRKGTEAGFRAYLNRFPDGLFSDLAREELAVIEEDRRAAEAEDEENAYDVARARDTVEAYRAFLADFPSGANADAAQARIDQLNAASGAGDLDAARAAEAALLKNQLAIVLVERRLAQIGFNPGRVDGRFDDAARTAIRRFQSSVGLPATGYFDARGLAALMNN